MASSLATCADDDDSLARRALAVCGTTWQKGFAAVQAAAVANASSPGGRARVLLFDTSGNGGLADRLTGMMTAFLLAVLTERAFALDWPGHELALSMPSISREHSSAEPDVAMY